MVSLYNVAKNFGKEKALTDISMNISSGCVHGLIGKNGSGKTTILNILLGLVEPSSGKIVYAKDKRSMRMGAAVSRDGFFNAYNAKKNLEIVATIRGVQTKDVETAMKLFGLMEFNTKPFRKYSEGMRQRLSLASAFMGNPEFIILDEPTNGLDFETTVLLRDAIIAFAQGGVTFLITSHVLTELEKVCDHITFISEGVVVKSAEKKELLQGYYNIENAYYSILQPTEK